MTDWKESTRLELGDVRLFALEAGAGDAVLFLAGLGYASWCWQEIMSELASRWRTVALDNRGSGRSDKPPGPYTIEQLAQDAASALEALGIRSAHVVGHSMGGYIALSLARRHRTVVRSLTLVGTSAGGASSVPVPQETLSAWLGAAGLPPAPYARRTMPLAYPPGWAEAHPERFDSLLQLRLRHPTPASTWAAQFEACQRYLEVGVEVGDLELPALIVHGAEDRVVPSENGRTLAGALPNAELLILDGRGHLCFLEAPGEFAAHLRRFLRLSS